MAPNWWRYRNGTGRGVCRPLIFSQISQICIIRDISKAQITHAVGHMPLSYWLSSRFVIMHIADPRKQALSGPVGTRGIERVGHAPKQWSKTRMQSYAGVSA